MSPSDFTFEWPFLGLAGAGAVAYAWFARGDPPGRRRVVAFVAGLFLLAAPLNSPLETLAAKYLLMMHLLQNALIADIAPLLILVGLTPRMRAALRLTSIRSRYALLAWLLAWYLTHLAGFYDWALRTGWGLDLEHAILVAAGFVFWAPLVTGRLAPPAALAYLGVAFVGSSFLGLAYIFSSSPFYSFYEHVPRIWGLSAIRDQNLGGIVMNSEQTIVFLVAIGWFISRLFAEEDERNRVSGADGSPARG
jgi:cytochrome c oxidase assembly factor CtaG